MRLDAVMKPSISQDLGRSHHFKKGGKECLSLCHSPSPPLPTLILWFANYFEARECLGSAFISISPLPAFNISQRPKPPRRRQTRAILGPSQGGTVSESIPPTNLPRFSPTWPSPLTTNTLKPLFLWGRLWLCSQWTRQKENAF